MQIAVVADSHVPARASEVPDEVIQACEDADIVAHAGDFVDQDTLEVFEETTDGFVAVHGNMDDTGLDLAGVESFTADGYEFAVVHGTGSPIGYEDRVVGCARDECDEPDAVIAGHTHEATDETHEGVRILNPGSCTGAMPADTTTYMVVETTPDGIEAEVFEL